MPDPAVTKVPIGYGADFKRATTLGGAYSTIGAIKDIAPPGATTSKVDQTGLNDAAALFRKQYRPGLIDFSESTVTIWFKAADFAQMKTDHDARTQLFYEFIFSDKANAVFVTTPSYLQFSGYVAGIEEETPEGEGVTAKIKFQPDGSTWVFVSGT